MSQSSNSLNEEKRKHRNESNWTQNVKSFHSNEKIYWNVSFFLLLFLVKRIKQQMKMQNSSWKIFNWRWITFYGTWQECESRNNIYCIRKQIGSGFILRVHRCSTRHTDVNKAKHLRQRKYTQIHSYENEIAKKKTFMQSLKINCWNNNTRRAKRTEKKWRKNNNKTKQNK